MKFTSSIAATILAVTASVSASPLEARQDALKDIQVNSISIVTPSGRPGEARIARFTANVTDPNEYKFNNGATVPGGSQGISCDATWFTGSSDSPADRWWGCESNPSGQGYWIMKLLPGTTGAFSTTNFRAKFAHRISGTTGGYFCKTVEGEGAFSQPDSIDGRCSSSGVCRWGLKGEVSPYSISTTVVEEDCTQV